MSDDLDYTRPMTLDELAVRIRNKKYLSLYNLALMFPHWPGSKHMTQQQENTQPSSAQPSESTPSKTGTK